MAPVLRRGETREPAKVAGAAAAAAAEVEAALTVPPDPTAAAFFDVDNTMMQGASIFHFARGLASRGFFHSRDLARFAWQQIAFRVGGQESAEGMADVWLITATPVELASIIARRLGLTGALGTVAETDENGCYTGRLIGVPLHGPAKAEAIRALAEREGLDLARCTSYSDSINDVPMLSAVGHAVAINPDPDLKKAAREHGWEVRDFRTARKAARIGVPTAAGVGAVAGGVVAGIALRKKYSGQGYPQQVLSTIAGFSKPILRPVREVSLPGKLQMPGLSDPLSVIIKWPSGASGAADVVLSESERGIRWISSAVSSAAEQAARAVRPDRRRSLLHRITS
jgi:phosphoserine phosphatase